MQTETEEMQRMDNKNGEIWKEKQRNLRSASRAERKVTQKIETIRRFVVLGDRNASKLYSNFSCDKTHSVDCTCKRRKNAQDVESKRRVALSVNGYKQSYTVITEPNCRMASVKIIATLAAGCFLFEFNRNTAKSAQRNCASKEKRCFCSDRPRHRRLGSILEVECSRNETRFSYHSFTFESAYYLTQKSGSLEIVELKKRRSRKIEPKMVVRIRKQLNRIGFCIWPKFGQFQTNRQSLPFNHEIQFEALPWHNYTFVALW